MAITQSDHLRGDVITYRFRCERLDSFMRECGISNVRLAAAVGIDRGTVYRIRTGRQVPSAPNLAAICHVLRIPQDWLMAQVPARPRSGCGPAARV